MRGSNNDKKFHNFRAASVDGLVEDWQEIT